MLLNTSLLDFKVFHFYNSFIHSFWVLLLYKDEKITNLKIVSVLTGLIGLIILFFSGATGLSNEGNLLIGGLLAVLGVQGLALSNITNKKDSQYIPARTYLLAQWIASTVFFF